MKYKCIFLLLTICCTLSAALGQNKFVYVNSKSIFGNIVPTQFSIAKIKVHTIATNMLVLPNYYTCNFGFFCKQELKLQKAIKVPFVFRLGSVQVVDYLEGKRGANISFR